jgi:hypothetical protein
MLGDVVVGNRVRISELNTQKQLNGTIGIIQDILDIGKVLIRISSEQNQVPKVLKLSVDKVSPAPIICKNGGVLRIGVYVTIDG